MRTIPLTQGKFTIVDDDMFEFLNQWKWHYCNNGYAARSQYEYVGFKDYTCKIIYLHRVLLPTTELVDHVNGNMLDNRMDNLRAANKSQNAANSKLPSDNTSGVKGVWWSNRSQRWIAEIRINKRKIHLGTFRNIVEAAEYRQKAIEKYFGEFGRMK